MPNRFTNLRRGLALAVLFATGSLAAQAQGVGVGTTAPDASAALDIVATNKGALLPRVASTSSVPSPATGLIVFQTGAPAGYYYNAGTPGTPSWQQLATASGAAITASNGLTKTDQSVALGGTLTQATTIATGGNVLAITGTGNVGIGTNAPIQKLDVTGGSIRISTAGQGLIFPDGSTETTANRALSIIGQNLTLDGTGGNTVVLPTAGPAGPAGTQGVVAVRTFVGRIIGIAPFSTTYVFAGGVATVTITSTAQKLVGSAAAPLGLAKGKQSIAADVGMCYQSTALGSPVIDFSGDNYSTVDITTTRTNIPASCAVSGLAPGTYYVGLGVRNTSGFRTVGADIQDPYPLPTYINNNDFVNGYVMVVN